MKSKQIDFDHIEHAAINLSTILDSGIDEFIKSIEAENNEDVLTTLYQMLTFEWEELEEADIKLNKAGAKHLEKLLDERGIEKPEIIK